MGTVGTTTVVMDKKSTCNHGKCTAHTQDGNIFFFSFFSSPVKYLRLTVSNNVYSDPETLFLTFIAKSVNYLCTDRKSDFKSRALRA